LLQFGGVALLAFVVIGVEGTARIVRARGGAPSLLGPYLFLTICCAILLAFVSFVYVRERDPEIVLLLLVLTIGAVLPIVILGRLWSV